jgi:hypothetical protein
LRSVLLFEVSELYIVHVQCSYGIVNNNLHPIPCTSIWKTLFKYNGSNKFRFVKLIVIKGLKWAAHVVQMEDVINAFRILVGMLLGRPKLW